MVGHSETITSLNAAFARGDVPTVLAALAPDISWTEAKGFPYGGMYVGHDAVLQNVFMKLGAEWDGFTVVPHELIAEAETVLVQRALQ